MAERTYPSYWMYKDTQGLWRWSYEASNGKTIAVSSESYHHRADCEHGIELMKKSKDSPIWFPSHLENAA